ncbi:alpha/beta hydrolase-fold protein [Sorangium sp. So ce291]|uniref:alpha/beta hydrolase-fold protein n=1 Tax=Sorangium sp. So ce291 TaxID=3133294 RepID=UPI003F64690D
MDEVRGEAFRALCGTMNYDRCTLRLRVVAAPDITPPEEALYVAGNFNSWNARDEGARLARDQEGCLSVQITTSLGTVLRYKFTRGSWDKVEGLPGGGFLPDRSTIVEADGQEITVKISSWNDLAVNVRRRSVVAGTVAVVRAFPMPQLGTSRRIWVYLPPDYDTSNRLYPVLYVQDGQDLFGPSSSFSGEWRIDETVERLYLEQASRGVIVVAPESGGPMRVDEYAPWGDEDDAAGGPGDRYADFLVHTLKPYVDAHFRTLRDRQSTGIAGSSMGGLLAFYAALKHQDVFSRVGAFSPSFGLAKRRIFDVVRAWAKEGRFHQRARTQIYLYAGGMGAGQLEGDEAVVEDTVEMFCLLRELGFSSDDLKLRRDDHRPRPEPTWASTFAEAYLWLYSDS